jgi:hypothetical protein
VSLFQRNWGAGHATFLGIRGHVETNRGITDFRRAAFFIATGAGAVHATGGLSLSVRAQLERLTWPEAKHIPAKARPWRYRPTETPPSWEALATAALERRVVSGPLGSSPAAAACRPSKATNWSAPVLWEPRNKAGPQRYRLTAILLSQAGLATMQSRMTVVLGPHGFSPAATARGPSKVTDSAARTWFMPLSLTPWASTKVSPSGYPPMVIPPSWAG